MAQVNHSANSMLMYVNVCKCMLIIVRIITGIINVC